MRIGKKHLLIAAGIAVLSGALVAPVLAHGWYGRGGPGMGLLETFDTNSDGRLTQAEIDEARAQQLGRFDADRNGQLSLAEYQALWADAMRERMVRGFQSHDRDGDGNVTAAEFQERFTDIVSRRDENNDGALTADELRFHGRRDGRGHGRDGDRD
jgi:Ca2+-binding EF-hand superfamily protein